MEIRIFEPSLPSPDIREISRYAGVRGECEEIFGQIETVCSALEESLKPAVCYAELPVEMIEGGVRIGNVKVRSSSLSELLSGADKAVIFAATVGISLDREIARLGARSPAKQLLADAFGTERVEALCDVFASYLEEKYGKARVTRRFSAGYGDVPLALQSDLFAILECPKRIGLTLNDSLLMSPSKSVTAIIGIRKN